MLLVASLFFYGWWDYRLVPLLLGTCFLNFWLGTQIYRLTEPVARKRWVAAGVVCNLAILGVFKYFNFFIDSARSLLELSGMHWGMASLNILLPLGISFFTFQGISWLVDIQRGKLEKMPSALDFFLYKTFFPQLVAGPVVRAVDFLPQLESAPQWRDINLGRALFLFLIGYVKKAVIADSIASVIDPLFTSPTYWNVPTLWFGAVAYSIQIYCDFSGYTDMARGSANLFGFSLCRNFEAPYFSRSLREFWQRWHISLSTWLRDYLYIPLGGSRGPEWKTYRNLFLTMMLGGLWHGAAWTFLLWGVAHGVGLIVERIWSASSRRVVPSPLSMPLCFVWVCLCFVIFRSPNLQMALSFLKGMFVPTGTHSLSGMNSRWMMLVALGALHGVFRVQGTRVWRSLNLWPAESLAFLFGLAVALTCFFTPLKATPFIYFQF